MSVLGIDLSLRSTGLFYNSDSPVYKLIQPNTSIKAEDLLWYIWGEISDFITSTNPDEINIEDLSLNSISSSKDVIAGNFWFIRSNIHKYYPRIKVNIISIKSWRCPLFTKEENKNKLEATRLIKQLKKENEYDTLPLKEKKQFNIDNIDLYLKADEKYLVWQKVPEPYKSEFQEIGFTKGCYDLSDSYFISMFNGEK